MVATGNNPTETSVMVKFLKTILGLFILVGLVIAGLFAIGLLAYEIGVVGEAGWKFAQHLNGG